MLIEKHARVPPRQRPVVQQALDFDSNSSFNYLGRSNSPSRSDEFDANNEFEAKMPAKTNFEFELDSSELDKQEDPVDSNGEDDARLAINLQYARDRVSCGKPSSFQLYRL